MARNTKRKDLPPQSPAADAPPAKSPKLTDAGGPRRTTCTTQGKGGLIFQLQKAADKIVAKPLPPKAHADMPPATTQNPMALQARPKPRKLTKAPVFGSNQENTAPVQPQQAAALPRRTDAVEGSPYGFRAGLPVGAGKAAPSAPAAIAAPRFTSVSASGPNLRAAAKSPLGYSQAALPAPATLLQRTVAIEGSINIDPALYAIDDHLLSAGSQNGRSYLPPSYGPARGSRTHDADGEDGNAAGSDGEDGTEDDNEDGAEGDGGDDGGDEDAGAAGSELGDGNESQGIGWSNVQDSVPAEGGDSFIDEQSPDEDERQARRFLAQPVAKGPRGGRNVPVEHRDRNHAVMPPTSQNAGTNPTATDLEGRDVLVEHRDRNHAVKPPTLGRLRNSGLQQPASSDEHSGGVGRAVSQSPVLQCPMAPSEPSPPASLNPARLTFYYQFPGWVSVLEDAKVKFRLRQVTSSTPFPTTERHASLASTCITEAMSDFCRDNVANVVLDESIYQKHRRKMVTMLFNDGASWRGRLKSKARLLVSYHYDDALAPDISELGGGQAEYYTLIRENVMALLDGSFLLGPPDTEDKPSNFAHPALKALCQEFFYNEPGDGLAKRFPDIFSTVPTGCLLLAATAIASSLEEYRTGTEIRIHFKGETYEHHYAQFKANLEVLQGIPFHANKIKQLLRDWASEALLRNGVATTIPTSAQQYKIFI